MCGFTLAFYVLSSIVCPFPWSERLSVAGFGQTHEKFDVLDNALEILGTVAGWTLA